MRIRTLDSPDTGGLKPNPERKVEDSKLSGYVWTGPCAETLLSQEICIGASNVSEKAIKESYLCGFGIGIYQFFFSLVQISSICKVSFIPDYSVRTIKASRGKCYQPSPRPRLITLTETLIIKDITKTESNNCFIVHCFEENSDKHTVARKLILLLEIRHCARNLQISQLSANR